MEEAQDKLIKEYRGGNEYALEEIFKCNRPLINRVVRKYFLIGAELDDLMQEGMIGLYRAIVSFDASKEANFKTYARICVERAVLNAIKSANSKGNIPLNNSIALDTVPKDDEDEEIFTAVDETNPESILISKEKYKKLFEKATQNLSVFEKNVLELYLDGLSYVEIAERLNKTPKSVDNGLTRIKSKITQNKLQNLED